MACRVANFVPADGDAIILLLFTPQKFSLTGAYSPEFHDKL
jgi:hypothetical protein